MDGQMEKNYLTLIYIQRSFGPNMYNPHLENLNKIFILNLFIQLFEGNCPYHQELNIKKLKFVSKYTFLESI